jgi:hypothetical protein
MCGKDVHVLDVPKHYQLKHQWPANENEGTKESVAEGQAEAGGNASPDTGQVRVLPTPPAA